MEPATDHEVDPISRIEGHLGVKVRVDAAGNVIVDANAHGNLWRGFENFLLGREANDAITFVQRICGVCPVPHGMTATYAVDNVLGLQQRSHHVQDRRHKGVPAKAVLIRNLVLSCRVPHVEHHALLSPGCSELRSGPGHAAVDSVLRRLLLHPLLRSSQGAGASRRCGEALSRMPNPATMQLWDAVIISYVRALKIRRLTFEAGALFAGRMPMTSCYVAAASPTTAPTADRRLVSTQFKSIIHEVGLFIVNEYVPIALARGALYPNFDNANNTGGHRGALPARP